MENNEHIPCVELKKLVKRFPETVAVENVSLKVKQGEVFSLLGPSGCGKTTTLRIIAGLETADEGEVLIDGQVVNKIPPYRRNCNLVFQNLALFPHMTVEENIAYGLERRKTPKTEIKEKIGKMLDLMHLAGMEKRYPAQISGGQKQRIALARSLVLEPKILLLDEPLASLDRKIRKELQVELRRIQKELGITFFYVTHDQRVALAISDTIAVMRAGRLEQIAPPDEIYDTPRTKFIADFMGATNIFSGRAALKGDREVRLESDEGLVIFAFNHKNIPVEKITGISVHPERIHVLAGDSKSRADNSFKGKIVEMVYQGDFVETKILLLNVENSRSIIVHLNTKLSQKSQFSIGKVVLVQWDKENSNILQD
ncbi:MAG: ABC transporter ATP-binding protein [Spirochaetota bacterium]|nr:MAG: ABC transporter ATP-binding protein [Spirochaetota bacterium]